MPPKQEKLQPKKRKRKKRQRPYTRSKRTHMIRRRRKHDRHGMRREAKMMNYLLHQMLKTMSAEPDKPHYYHPRHHTKDPEYQHSGQRLQEFKRSVPSPDVHFWQPQGKGLPTHRGNYPRERWEPQWAYAPAGEDDPAWAGYGSDADMY